MSLVKRFLLLMFVTLLTACIPRAAFKDYRTELVNAISEGEEHEALASILQLAYEENLLFGYAIYNKTKDLFIDNEELTNNMNGKYFVIIKIENMGKSFKWETKYNQNLILLTSP